MARACPTPLRHSSASADPLPGPPQHGPADSFRSRADQTVRRSTGLMLTGRLCLGNAARNSKSVQMKCSREAGAGPVSEPRACHRLVACAGGWSHRGVAGGPLRGDCTGMPPCSGLVAAGCVFRVSPPVFRCKKWVFRVFVRLKKTNLFCFLNYLRNTRNTHFLQRNTGRNTPDTLACSRGNAFGRLSSVLRTGRAALQRDKRAITAAHCGCLRAPCMGHPLHAETARPPSRWRPRTPRLLRLVNRGQSSCRCVWPPLTTGTGPCSNTSSAAWPASSLAPVSQARSLARDGARPPPCSRLPGGL